MCPKKNGMSSQNNGSVSIKDTDREKEIYEYWYLGNSSYEVLKLKQNIWKNKVVTGKTPFRSILYDSIYLF